MPGRWQMHPGSKVEPQVLYWNADTQPSHLDADHLDERIHWDITN